MLSVEQLQDYERDGFLVLKGQIPDVDIDRFERGVERNPPLDGTLDTGGQTYPAPGRYTLAQNCLKDPDLAPLAEHPAIVPAARDILGAEPRLSAFVIYDRTPGGPGIPIHNDYKRWRPVGSSMNWAFTIVPFCDFDSAAGQLFVAPGSHQLERVAPVPSDRFVLRHLASRRSRTSSTRSSSGAILLLMNMHLWHRASGNQSDHHRVGAFNKYAAVDAPPATGYFLYDDDVHDALSDDGRSFLAVH